ncbi:hypothetical protein SORBI_3008G039750 [Sorghum bicolor]|uniref:Uncharacterized protein n=1 Tax=Sorghum bicolor TaxID=4558 RepID=A0A1Z5R5K0_SORBI|nr:hypothetical protein SORBI_3008G039750 [Sorghum bicolor]
MLFVLQSSRPPPASVRKIGEVGSAISNPSRIQDVVDASGTGCRGVCQCQPAQASAAAKLLEPQMGVAAGRPAPPGRVAVAGRRRRPARLRPLPGPSAAAGGPARTPRLAARRWMMLPEGHGLYPGHADLGGYARFLNLDTRRMLAVRLLHPFTGDVTDLPPLAPLLPQLGTVLLSCPAPYTGSRSSRTWPVLLLASVIEVEEEPSPSPSRLCVFLERAMDSGKLAIAIRQCNTPFPFRGKLSCGRNVHQVLQIDPPVQDEAASSSTGFDSSSMSQILAYKPVDLVQQRFLRVTSIGGNCLIAGERSMSVSSRVLPTVEGDSVIHVSLKKTTSEAVDDCRAQGPSDLVHCLFSCRTCSLWNRGLVYRRKPQADAVLQS